jgi:ribosomal protein L11 methyltransferase
VLVETLVGGLDQAPSGEYDVVVANLLASTVTQLASPLYGRTRPGGTCVASGVMCEQAPAVTAALQAAGFHAPVTTSSGDWVALTVQRPAARR